MDEPATVKVIEHTDPSPVPESNWVFRRWYVFVVTGLLCLHIGWTTMVKVDDPRVLREVIRNDQFLIMLFALLYLAGANAENIAQVVAAVRTSRRETTTTAPPPATITTTAEGATKVDTPPTGGRE